MKGTASAFILTAVLATVAVSVTAVAVRVLRMRR